ncbi:MAG: phenylacetate--CoA ligase family protein, partial [Nitrospinaceae bacterium]|nr:phenylacetate--CoA ligase family protein [Nitrospinaceae bacterium]NIR53279.1 phenylacetate--CoA ligase family protein [Nitrospinaceae bacterium]NIS83678.1 phenylacetate--CoA ligase family protein [Nitrospinaceae bacterium]NIT80474.1 phenylacetate--CoA ligase family protein [Nitrospinaceae bacterium]NIU42804.1 phenylacetate--CoA ligase family protein [Nitrospinaceae bacterium]
RFKPHILKLPLLFLFGRNDSSLSYMGANINPQDVEYGLYRDEKFAWRIESFCLSLDESPELTPSPTVNIQLRQGIRLPGEELHRMKDFLESAILDHLCRVSRDFNQAFREDP